MLADKGIGEWGHAALIEVDGYKILFDTGNKPKTVLQNALDLNIDLSDVEDVFLSHNHSDHTGGLLTLRNYLRQKIQKPSLEFMSLKVFLAKESMLKMTC